MSNQNDTEQGSKNPISEKTSMFMDTITTLWGIYRNPSKVSRYTNSLRDLAVRAYDFLIVATLFLLLYNYLPLFDEPTKAISIHQTIQGTSGYLQTHALYSLFAQSWCVITFFIFGWVTLIFTMHYRRAEEQAYMLGMTLLVFSVIILYVIIRFGIGLFLVKAIQRWFWPETIMTFTVEKMPVEHTLCFLLLIPIIFIAINVSRNTQKRGLATLAFFCILVWGTYKIFKYYFPVKVPAAPIVRLPQKNPTSASIPVTMFRKDSLYDNSNSGESVARPIASILLGPTDNYVHIDTKSIATQIDIAALVADDSLIRFKMYYHRRGYIIYTEVKIENKSDTALELPYYKSLRLNFIAGSTLLRRQDKSHSGDFVFDIFGLHKRSITSKIIQAHTNKVIRLRGRFSARTYDYLLRYLRNNEVSHYTVKFIVGMDHRHKTIDVECNKNLVFQFVNKEIYGLPTVEE